MRVLRVLTLLHFATAGPGIATAVNQHREDASCRDSSVHSSSAVCREFVLSACSLARSALRSVLRVENRIMVVGILKMGAKNLFIRV